MKRELLTEIGNLYDIHMNGYRPDDIPMKERHEEYLTTAEKCIDSEMPNSYLSAGIQPEYNMGELFMLAHLLNKQGRATEAEAVIAILREKMESFAEQNYTPPTQWEPGVDVSPVDAIMDEISDILGGSEFI